jgi:hypothetical protein
MHKLSRICDSFISRMSKLPHSYSESSAFMIGSDPVRSETAPGVLMPFPILCDSSALIHQSTLRPSHSHDSSSCSELGFESSSDSAWSRDVQPFSRAAQWQRRKRSPPRVCEPRKTDFVIYSIISRTDASNPSHDLHCSCISVSPAVLAAAPRASRSDRCSR